MDSNGLLVVTFEFPALTPAPQSPISIVLQQGGFAETRVFAPAPAQTNVLGSVEGTTVTILSCLSGDWDTDGDVDLVDFAALQRCFTGSGGTAGDACACAFDFDLDLDVDIADHAVFVPLISGP